MTDDLSAINSNLAAVSANVATLSANYTHLHSDMQEVKAKLEIIGDLRLVIQKITDRQENHEQRFSSSEKSLRDEIRRIETEQIMPLRNDVRRLEEKSAPSWWIHGTAAALKDLLLVLGAGAAVLKAFGLL